MDEKVAPPLPLKFSHTGVLLPPRFFHTSVLLPLRFSHTGVLLPLRFSFTGVLVLINNVWAWDHAITIYPQTMLWQTEKDVANNLCCMRKIGFVRWTMSDIFNFT